MKTTITISTEVYSSLNQAWRSWTSAHHIVNWNFASDTWHCPQAEITFLDNFKKYTESLDKMERLSFEIVISAPVEKVYEKMLGSESYKEWTAAFHPSSFYRGKWEEGEKMLFLGLDENGNEGGMVSRIKKIIPNKIVTIEHYGIFDSGMEIVEGTEVRGWAGAIEEYQFEMDSNITLLKVISDCNLEYKSYFEEAWPKALAKLKSICEQ